MINCKAEAKYHLEEIFKILNRKEKHIVELRFFENKTFGEIGEIYKITRQAAHQRINRIIKKMKKFEETENIIKPKIQDSTLESETNKKRCGCGKIITKKGCGFCYAESWNFLTDRHKGKVKFKNRMISLNSLKWSSEPLSAQG